jgi:hypothetical protein
VRPSLPNILLRSEVRLAALGLSAVAAVYFGFLGLDVEPAGMVVKRFGYYFMLVTFGLWVAALIRLWQGRAPGQPLTRREWLFATLAIGLLSLVAINAEAFRSKILYDEFVLQSTAYNMHYFRDTATMVRGYDVLGVFISTDNYLDKRPNFYPFLISLAHDLTGYRPANAYWLNAVLLPVTLGLVYYLGRRLNGLRGGLLAVLLLGSLPLLGQNATGSSMELLNVAMILAVAGLGAAWLRTPDETRLSALVLGAVLLAQTRYESAIYVAPVALLIALGWWQARRITLSWTTVLAPLLLLPYALQNKVLSNTKWMWELRENQETRFSVDYLAGNLQGARDFFFNPNARLANSWPLAALGLLALGFVVWRLLRARPAPTAANADHTALLLLGLAMVTNTVLILFYYWSNLGDPIASRFSLPFHLALAFAVVVAAAALDRRWPASRLLLGAMIAFACGVTTSRHAQHLYSYLGIDEVEWEKRYIAALPPGERLIISNKSTLPWLLIKTPSILIGRARIVADRLQYQLEQGTFRDILVLQSLRPTSRDGDHQLVPEERLPPGYELELVTEKRFGTKIARISRLVAVQLPAPGAPAAPAIP